MERATPTSSIDNALAAEANDVADFFDDLCDVLQDFFVRDAQDQIAADQQFVVAVTVPGETQLT